MAEYTTLTILIIILLVLAAGYFGWLGICYWQTNKWEWMPCFSFEKPSKPLDVGKLPTQ